MNAASRPALGELALVFLKLGMTSFGGPAGHTAMMQNEFVRRRRWLTEAEFLDLVGATNLIPGPNSTELAIHIGLRRGGLPGLAIAGLLFILPASLIVTAIARAYVSYGTLPEAGGILYGIKPVVIAIVVQALVSLVRAAVKNRGLAIVGALAVLLALLGLHELVVLFGSAALYMAWRLGATRQPGAPGLLPVLLLAGTAAPGAGVAMAPLFLVFLKAGALLFGSGYVLLAFLRADLVERLGWLTEAQLVDAVAVGQVTPGPLFTTATFIGYTLAGAQGALLATVAIFLPAFLFVAISAPYLARLRESAAAGHFLDSVNVASLALMAVVAWNLGRSAIVDAPTLAIAVGAAFALFRFRLNPSWLILAGAGLGLAGSLYRP